MKKLNIPKKIWYILVTVTSFFLILTYYSLQFSPTISPTINSKKLSNLDSFLYENFGFTLNLGYETEQRVAIYCDPNILLSNKGTKIDFVCENQNPAHKIVIGLVSIDQRYLSSMQALGNQQLFWSNKPEADEGKMACVEDQDYLKFEGVLFGVNCTMTLRNGEKLYSSTVLLQKNSNQGKKVFISILNTNKLTSEEKVKKELTSLLKNKNSGISLLKLLVASAYAESGGGTGGSGPGTTSADVSCTRAGGTAAAPGAACGATGTASNGGQGDPVGAADATVCDINTPTDCYTIYCDSTTAYWDVSLLKCVEPPVCTSNQVSQVVWRYRCFFPSYTYGKEDTFVPDSWSAWQSTAPSCVTGWTSASLQSVPTYTCNDLPSPPTLSASPSTIYEGQSATISWGASSYASSCTGSGGTFAGAKSIAGGSQSTGLIATAGSYQYTITCSNAYGSSAPVSTTVTVNTAYSDLTAAAATPSNAVPGTTNTLSAVISNIGLASTGGSFSNFFQVADQVGGGGTITDLPSVSMGALVAGANNTATKNYTFPNGPGTYSVRVCADKTSSAGGGVINEGANEGNNCGTPWTTVTVACTGTNRWDSVNGVCVDPQVVLAYITDQHYPPGDIHLSCNADTDSYSVFKGGALFIGPNQYTAPVILNDVVTESNSYVIKCIHGSVEDQIAVPYDANIPPAVVKLIATETTIDPPASTTIKWEVDYPTAACTLTAKVVCANDACTAAQLANEASINTILSTTNTDPNDPSTSRSMLSAIQSPAPGHKDSDTPIITADYKALGKKTIPVKYTTDITYNCNGTKETKRIRVIKSEEQ